MGCNTTNTNYFYFEATTEGGITALALQSTALLNAVFQYFAAPVSIDDAITLWGLIARKLWYSISTDNEGLNALNSRVTFLRPSIVAASPPLSYIQLSY